jgi:hypothetical protein
MVCSKTTVWTIGYNMTRKEAAGKLGLTLDTVTQAGSANPTTNPRCWQLAAQHWQQAFQASCNNEVFIFSILASSIYKPYHRGKKNGLVASSP